MEGVSYRCASLQVESPDGGPVVHGVEGGDLVDSHGWHLQYPRHFVHHTDAREAMLPLPKVEEWHHGGFLILGWVAFEDLVDQLLADGGELERYLRVVVGGISVLKDSLVRVRLLLPGVSARAMERTTYHEERRAARAC